MSDAEPDRSYSLVLKCLLCVQFCFSRVNVRRCDRTHWEDVPSARSKSGSRWITCNRDIWKDADSEPAFSITKRFEQIQELVRRGLQLTPARLGIGGHDF